MGNCQPTSFAEHMGDDDILTAALTAWGRQGIPGGLMHADAVARALVDALGVALNHPQIDSSEIRFDARP